MAKNQSLPAHFQEKNSRGEDNLTMHESHEKPTAWWPRPSLSSPRSTNDIVWVVLRANPTLLRFVTNRVLTNIFISCNLTDTFNIFIIDDQNLNPPSPQFKIQFGIINVRTRFVTNRNSVGFARKTAQTISFVERGFEWLGLGHQAVGFSWYSCMVKLYSPLEVGWEALVFCHFSQPFVWCTYLLII